MLLINSEIKNINALKTSPNPAGHNVTVDFLLDRKSNYKLDIYNFNGTVVKSFSGSAEAGTKNISIGVAALSNGKYIAKLSVNNDGKNSTLSSNFIVVH